MRWQSSLPRVATIALWPLLVTDKKMVGLRAAAMASKAMRVLPLVPFLKPTGQGNPEASFAMNLGFGGAGADRAPRDEVGKVPGTDQVEILCPGGEPHFVDIEQHARARRAPC